MSQDAASILLRAHLNSITQSLQALESLSLIPPSDASLIRSKLPSSEALANANTGKQDQYNRSSYGGSAGLQPSSISSPGGSMLDVSVGNGYNSGGIHRAPPPIPGDSSERVEAVAAWDYSGNAADDLSFRKDDRIIVVDELNPDWWKGRLANDYSSNPRIGLFPSSYVNKLPSNNNWANKHQPPSQPQQQMQPYYAPPPPSQMQSYQPPPPPQNQQVQQVQQAGQVGPPVAPKPSRFGGMGQVLATSAVGGVGFGAGSAIGGGIINAIF
ncbi:Adaptor protein GRB2, contains SH2 and SH3 domains [Phaffia rhodozyma]|uniref:Adaptor protein GRB2, contains SH2 and SH3 domains n=1 Tax=Phaffia rhodozyma TaxID=264483 RepID=A0A0F7SRV4_PHARH|nr:Adaptor protein GRB2, contains SH2 and SH3 domains [Phaffia rhodozyma]